MKSPSSLSSFSLLIALLLVVVKSAPMIQSSECDGMMSLVARNSPPSSPKKTRLGCFSLSLPRIKSSSRDHDGYLSEGYDKPGGFYYNDRQINEPPTVLNSPPPPGQEVDDDEEIVGGRKSHHFGSDWFANQWMDNGEQPPVENDSPEHARKDETQAMQELADYFQYQNSLHSRAPIHEEPHGHPGSTSRRHKQKDPSRPPRPSKQPKDKQVMGDVFRGPGQH